MDIHGKSVDMDMDMDDKFHIHGKPAKSWPNPWEHLLHVTNWCFCAGFGLTANYEIDGLTAVIYGFTAVYGFIAITCNLVVTFVDAHWAELIRPQRWAGVRACPPWKQGKARQGKDGHL